MNVAVSGGVRGGHGAGLNGAKTPAGQSGSRASQFPITFGAQSVGTGDCSANT